MTEGLSLEFLQVFAVAAVLYWSEVVVALPPGRFGFVATIGRAYARVGPGLALRSLMPFGRWLQSEGTTLCFGERGVFAYQPHRVSSGRPPGWGRRYHDYARIEQVTRQGSAVLVNGASFYDAVSPHGAARIAQALREVTALPQAERAAWIDAYVAASLDAPAAARLLEATARRVWPVRVTASLFTLVSVVLLARVVLAAEARSEEALLWAAACVTPLWLLVVGHVVLAHRALRPEHVGERWLKALTLVLAPAIAGKAADWLTRDALAGFHWLVAARLVTAPARFAALAGAALRELDHPGRERWSDPEAAAREAQESYERRFARELERALREAGLDPSALRAAPAVDDEPGVVARCPRCNAPYTKAVVSCADCGAVMASRS